MGVVGMAAGMTTLLSSTSVTAVVLVNGVFGSYQDSNGRDYRAASNSVSVATSGVSAEMVLPKNNAVAPLTDGALAGTVTSKTFTISNISNISDAYLIRAVSASAGSVQSVTLSSGQGTPLSATVGSTISPTVVPGAALTVAVAVSTVGVSVGSAIELKLSAQTTAKSQNGLQTDTGEVWVYVARGPQLVGLPPPSTAPASGTNSATLPIAQYVNGAGVAQAAPGAGLSFLVPFTNIGDAPALNVIVTAKTPPQLQPVPGSITLQFTDHRTGKPIAAAGGVSVTSAARAQVMSAAKSAFPSGNSVIATIPRLDPGIDVALAYDATPLASALVGSVLTAGAAVSADEIPSIATSPAVVLVGKMNVVYDAIGGAGHPIAGAVVSIVNPVSGAPARLPGNAVAPNVSNANPFTVDATGAFAFALAAAAVSPAEYQLDVTAGGYLNRRIKLGLRTGEGGLPVTTLTALDGLPLAVDGGFALATTPVSAAGISGFFGNIPLFPPQLLMLTMTADRSVASAGDRLGLQLEFGPGSKPLPYPGTLVITLPRGTAYARGSARLDSIGVEPLLGGTTLSWPLANFSDRHTLSLDAVLVPGVTEGAAINLRAHLTAFVGGIPLGIDSGAAVTVLGGILSPRAILTGRVFTDEARDGHFVPGDTGVPGVRIYLEDGESVLTDAAGRFSFPATRPGMHVLHLDPITLPAGLHPYRGFSVTDPRSAMRLVHGIFDSGLMSDVNFAVRSPGH